MPLPPHPPTHTFQLLLQSTRWYMWYPSAWLSKTNLSLPPTVYLYHMLSAENTYLFTLGHKSEQTKFWSDT